MYFIVNLLKDLGTTVFYGNFPRDYPKFPKQLYLIEMGLEQNNVLVGKQTVNPRAKLPAWLDS